ncbi:transcobalamin-1-like [Pelodiscus sinensis]|uniref:transcobalamin-1-like n=1 Tax=Pelodiscus sinensis TaxID=13735 RepID=UPI003F6C986F
MTADRGRMKSLVITLAWLLLLFLASGGLCRGCGAPPPAIFSRIGVTYTVSDSVYKSFNDSIYVTLPQGSFFFNVMDIAQTLDSRKFSFTYTLSVWGAYITSVRGLQANDTQRTYWQLLSNRVPLKLGAGCYAVSSGESLEVSFSKY